MARNHVEAVHKRNNAHSDTGHVKTVHARNKAQTFTPPKKRK